MAIKREIPEYPAKPYIKQGDEGYYDPFTAEVTELDVNHSGRGKKGPFALAAWAIPTGSDYVLQIDFKGGSFQYPAIRAQSVRELQIELDIRQGPSLSLACNPKSDTYNPAFSNYVRV